MSKIVQYDNLLVNFAYFGAFIENISKKKGGGVQFFVQSRLHAVLVTCLTVSLLKKLYQYLSRRNKQKP